MVRLILLKKLLQKSRLSYYKNILELAIANGYYLTSLIDWYKNNYYPGKKILILRHDVDHDAAGALKMFTIEKELGVKSTFYFRWNTMSSDIMHQMHNNNFEVSLHYETLATYCKKNSVFSKNQVTSEVLEACYNQLEKELKTFNSKFWKTHTICSHGDKRNRLLGITNFEILKEPNKRKSLDIDFEAYDPEIIKHFDIYISDSSLKYNHQWKGPMNPEEAINKSFKNICLLTHPLHWNYNVLKTIRVITRQIKEDHFNLI